MPPATRALILVHPVDNVLIACRAVAAGEAIDIDGVVRTLAHAVDLGHKIARRDLAAGDKVIRYGAPIGSMTVAACAGEHVHLHNMKSDYIASHTREAAHIDRDGQ